MGGVWFELSLKNGGIWGDAERWRLLAKMPCESKPEADSTAVEASSGSRGWWVHLGNIFCMRIHETLVCSLSSLATVTRVRENKVTQVKWTFLFQKFLLAKAARLTISLTSQRGAYQILSLMFLIQQIYFFLKAWLFGTRS